MINSEELITVFARGSISFPATLTPIFLPVRPATLSMELEAGTINVTNIFRRITIVRPSAAAGSSLRTTAASTCWAWRASALALRLGVSVNINCTRGCSVAISRLIAATNLAPSLPSGPVAIRIVYLPEKIHGYSRKLKNASAPQQIMSPSTTAIRNIGLSIILTCRVVLLARWHGQPASTSFNVQHKSTLPNELAARRSA